MLPKRYGAVKIDLAVAVAAVIFDSRLTRQPPTFAAIHFQGVPDSAIRRIAPIGFVFRIRPFQALTEWGTYCNPTRLITARVV